MFPSYGDLHGAWGQASGHITNTEFIEVEFAEEVYVTEIHIYETYHSGGIVNIKIKDKSINDWRSVWQAEAGPTHIGIFKENISKC